jgi:hypothetical protein
MGHVEIQSHFSSRIASETLAFVASFDLRVLGNASALDSGPDAGDRCAQIVAAAALTGGAVEMRDHVLD